MPAPRSGFTLVEVVITVTIMAIISAIAVPQYMASASKLKAQCASKRLATDLDWARTQAIGGSKSVSVSFDFANQSYTLQGVGDLNSSATDSLIDLRDSPYEATLLSGSLTAGSSLTFSHLGQADGDGSVTVGHASNQITLTITAESGRVEINQ